MSAQRQAILEARARKADEARASGYWIVAPGEHLRLIAQQFFHGDHERQARLRRYFLEHDPDAFVHGDPDRLRPGARLDLPPELAASGAAPSKRASTPPPPAATARERAGATQPAPVTAIPAPEFAPGPPPRPRPPQPAAYVDQLIEGVAPESEAEAAADEAASAPGQRYVSAEYRAEARDPPGGGHGLEQGVELRLRRETLNYGDFYVEGAMRDTRLAANDASVRHRDGGRFTLYHDQFPVVEGWLADSTLGVVRTPANFLNSSYRISLPTSLVGGASSVVSDGRQTMTVYGGRIGQLEGSATQSFLATTGTLAGMGYGLRTGPWTVGGQAIRLQGNSIVRDHTAMTLAGEYGAPGDRMHDKAQLVYDEGSHIGAWFDGDLVSGRTRHRFGVYHLDPDLQWGDTPVTSDQRGAYWRADYRLLRYTLSGGIEANETNLRDDPAKPATRSGTGYGSFSLRVDRNLSVGAGLTYEGLRTRHSSSPRGSTLSGNAYLAWNGPLGLSRLDVNGFRTAATGESDNTVDSIAWSQEWPMLGPVRWSSTLTLAQEEQLGVRSRRSSLGVSARGALLNDAQWDASVVYGRIVTGGVAEDNVNVSATASWPFAQHWLALAQVNINTFDAVPLLPGSDLPATQRDKRFLLGLRYEESSGTPYRALGMAGGRGAGSLSGVVFFDENGDGMRQPTERPAANITVYLDGRYPATTDAQGRYVFPLVSAGSHSLRILNEALPLPWSIDDEHPRSALVPLRGETIVDIPLTRIRP